MTTVSHIDSKGAQMVQGATRRAEQAIQARTHQAAKPIQDLQGKNPALVFSAQYPTDFTAQSSLRSAYLYYIYSGIPINRDANFNAPMGSEREGIDHRIKSTATAQRRWCAEKGCSTRGRMSGVSRQRTSSAIVRNHARRGLFAAQYATESSIEQQIRHNINCCGGSIFARYD